MDASAEDMAPSPSTASTAASSRADSAPSGDHASELLLDDWGALQNDESHSDCQILSPLHLCAL